MKKSWKGSERMGIYLPNIEMPKTGCYILSVDNTGKDKTIFTIAEQTHSGKIIPRYVCEAVSVPPHGDLFDADALMYNIGDVPYKGSVRRVLLSAPTIIHASKKEE